MIAKRNIWLRNKDLFTINELYLIGLLGYIENFNRNVEMVRFAFEFYKEMEVKIHNLYLIADDYVKRRSDVSIQVKSLSLNDVSSLNSFKDTMGNFVIKLR
jgi:hypothetical protein